MWATNIRKKVTGVVGLVEEVAIGRNARWPPSTTGGEGWQLDGAINGKSQNGVVRRRTVNLR